MRKTHSKPPGACRWMLGWRWGQNSEHNTDAGQQSVDRQRESWEVVTA